VKSVITGKLSEPVSDLTEVGLSNLGGMGNHDKSLPFAQLFQMMHVILNLRDTIISHFWSVYPPRAVFWSRGLCWYPLPEVVSGARVGQEEDFMILPRSLADLAENLFYESVCGVMN
jgi:hypothetical protein